VWTQIRFDNFFALIFHTFLILKLLCQIIIMPDVAKRRRISEDEQLEGSGAAVVTKSSSDNTAAILPKDLFEHARIDITSNDDFFDDKDSDSEFSLGDLESGEIVKQPTVTLLVPFAKCWSAEDAKKMFPTLTDDDYKTGEYELATMSACMVRGFDMNMAVMTRDLGNMFMYLDGVDQSLYECVNACTNIEEKMGKESHTEHIPLYKTAATLRKTPLPGNLGFIFIQDVEIHDRRFRGQGYGPFFIDWVLRVICDECHGAFIKPHPRHWPFFERMGFSDVEGSIGYLARHVFPVKQPKEYCKFLRDMQ